MLEPPPLEPKGRITKRKQHGEASSPAESRPEKKRARKAAKNTATLHQSPSSTLNAGPCRTPARQRRQKPSRDANIDIIELSDSEEELRLPPSRLPLRSSVNPAAAQIVDFGSPSSFDEEPDVMGHIDAKGFAVLQTPSRTKYRNPASLIDADKDDERYLQLALRSNMHKQTASSLARNRKLLRDEPLIDSMRARTMQSHAMTKTSEPCVKASDVFVETRPGPTAASRCSMKDSAIFERRATSPRSSFGSPYLAGPPNAVSKRQHLDPDSTGRSSVQEGLHTSSSFEGTRAARVRHLQSSSTATPNIESLPKIAAPSIQSSQQARVTLLVPVGANCIDLTED